MYLNDACKAEPISNFWVSPTDLPQQIWQQLQNNLPSALAQEFDFLIGWMHLSHEQQLRAIFQSRDDKLSSEEAFDQTNLLLRWALISHGNVEGQHEEDNWELFNSPKAEQGEVRLVSCLNDLDFDEPPQLHNWGKAIFDFGPLQFNRDYLLYPCVTKFLQGKSFLYVSVDRDSLSAHEKLEAKLQLLEWARENLPPEALARAMEIESKGEKNGKESGI